MADSLVNRVGLRRVDTEEWRQLSSDADYKSHLAQIKSDFKSYRRRQKERNRDRTILLKQPLTESRLKQRGLRRQMHADIKRERDRLSSAIEEIRSKRPRVYASNAKKELGRIRDQAIELAYHKYAPTGKNDLIKKANDAAKAAYNHSLHQLSTVIFDRETASSCISALKEAHTRRVSAIKTDAAAEIADVIRTRVGIKKDVKKALSLHRTDRRAAWLVKRRLVREQISEARAAARTALKAISSSRIYLNSLYEPIEDEQEKVARFEKRAARAGISEKWSASEEASYRAKALVEALTGKASTSLQRVRTARQRAIFEAVKSARDNSFEWKAKYLAASLRNDHYVAILGTMERSDAEIAAARNDLAQTVASVNAGGEKRAYQARVRELKTETERKVAQLRADAAKGKFTRESLRRSIRATRREFRSDRHAARFSGKLLSARERLRFANIDRSAQVRKGRAVLNSQVEDAVRSIPVKSFRGQRWAACFLSLFLPGVGQLINRQYAKGIFLLLGAGIVYGLLLPLAAGWISNGGAGVAGLGDLSPTTISIGTLQIYADARFRLIEGIIGVMAITAGLIYLVMSARDGYLFGKARELGIRAESWRALRRYFQNRGLPYLLSIPAILGVTFTVLLPLIATILLAFTDYSIGHIPPGNPLAWIGFDNIAEVFGGLYGRSFGYVSQWTVLWTVAVSGGVIAIGTFMAFLVDQRRLKAKILWKTVFILPWAVPAFATILFFSAAFGGSGDGIYNQLFGVANDFKQSTTDSRAILIFIQIWLGHSYVFLLVTGVKKSISNDLYEAAQIDGAGKMRQFATISAPLILFQIAPLLIGQIVFAFNNYSIIWLFNDGGPNPTESYIGSPGSTDIIISLIFKMTTSSANNQIALASAFTIIVSFFIVVASGVAFARSKAFKEIL